MPGRIILSQDPDSITCIQIPTFDWCQLDFVAAFFAFLGIRLHRHLFTNQHHSSPHSYSIIGSLPLPVCRGHLFILISPLQRSDQGYMQSPRKPQCPLSPSSSLSLRRRGFLTSTLTTSPLPAVSVRAQYIGNTGVFAGIYLTIHPLPWRMLGSQRINQGSHQHTSKESLPQHLSQPYR